MFTAILILCLPLLSFDIFALEEGVTKDSITLGQSVDLRGTLSPIGIPFKEGAQLYFDHINQSGGVKGKKIKVLSYDDMYEPEKTVVNTIDLIRNKKIFALFGYLGTPNLIESLPVIQKFSSSGIFLFANYSGGQPQREKPHSDYVYNIRSSYKEEAAGLVDHLVKLGKKRIALFIQYDAYGRAGAHGIHLQLQKYNLDVVAETTYLRGIRHTESMKEQVAVIKKAQSDAIICVGVADATSALIRDARLGGLDVPIATFSPDSTELLIHLKDLSLHNIDLTKKIITSQIVPPWSDDSYPLIKEYQTITKKAGKQGSTDSLEGFLNAKVFVEILKQIKGEITRKNFHRTARSIRSLDVGLKKDKVSFYKSNQALRGIYYTTIKNDRYVIINDWNDFK